MSFSGTQKAIVLVFFCVLGVVCDQCCATIVSIEISGWVTEVDDRAGALDGQIDIGQEFTGFYIYDSSASDSKPLSADVGEYKYESPPFGIFLNINGVVFESNPQDVEFLIEVRNDYDQKDGYLITSSSNLSLANDTEVSQILWQLEYDNLTTLDSDALTVTAPVLEDWFSNNLRITCGRTAIRGVVTDAQAYVIPEPATAAIMVFGAIIAGLGRGRR